MKDKVSDSFPDSVFILLQILLIGLVDPLTRSEERINNTEEKFQWLGERRERETGRVRGVGWRPYLKEGLL